MSNAADRLKLGEAVLALIERKRAETDHFPAIFSIFDWNSSKFVNFIVETSQFLYYNQYIL